MQIGARLIPERAPARRPDHFRSRMLLSARVNYATRVLIINAAARDQYLF